MRREAKKLLLDMQRAGEAVASFAKARTFEHYVNDLMFRSAVERQLYIVGEAFTQLDRWDEALADSFEQRREIVGFRTRLAHGYSVQDDRQVWDIAVTELPKLLLKIEALLAE